MTRLVRPARILLVVYSVLLAIALLSPTSTVQSDMVYLLSVRLVHAGLQLATYTRLEVVMNALIVAPVTFLATFVIRRPTWRDWTTYGFLLSAAVETTQLLFLPSRQASFSDVVANTGGACLGALVATLVRRRVRATRGR